MQRNPNPNNNEDFLSSSVDDRSNLLAKRMEDQSSNSLTQQATKTIIPCTICGAPSRGVTYGVIACQSCKTFFRRTAERKLDEVICHFDGHCEININTRHTCAHCRLAKCLAMGMQKDLFRGPIPKQNLTNKKRKTTNEEEVQIISTVPARSNQSELIPTLNLLRSDLSTLTVDQWNLLSNLSHCYDDHAGLSLGEQYMVEQNNLPHKLRFKTASVVQLYQLTLDATQSLYKNNRDFLSLSIDDRSILLNTTVAHTASISSNFILNKIQLMGYAAYYDALEIMAGSTTVSIVKRLASRLYFDVTVMKLFLAILSFSTVRYTVYSNDAPGNLSSPKQVLGIQDQYIELTWRYLLHRYDHEQAVKFLSDFMRCVFLLIDALDVAYTISWFTDAVDSITEKTQQTFSLNE